MKDLSLYCGTVMRSIIVLGSFSRGLIRSFSEDEPEYEALDGSIKGQLQMTEEFSDPSSLFDSVFMSMSDTLNSINTLESSDQTPEDRPLNTTNTTPISPPDTR